MRWAGTVVQDLAISTIASASRRPKPNLWLKWNPAPFVRQPSSTGLVSLAVLTTMCCTSRHVSLLLKQENTSSGNYKQISKMIQTKRVTFAGIMLSSVSALTQDSVTWGGGLRSITTQVKRLYDFSVTYLASNIRAIIPAARGAADEVPLNCSVHWWWRSVVIYKNKQTKQQLDTIRPVRQTSAKIYSESVKLQYIIMMDIRQWNYGHALWEVLSALAQPRGWLVRPIREWQSLAHWLQVWSEAGLSPWLRAFLLCLFVSFCCASESLYFVRPFCTVCLHAAQLRKRINVPFCFLRALCEHLR